MMGTGVVLFLLMVLAVGMLVGVIVLVDVRGIGGDGDDCISGGNSNCCTKI